MKEEKKEECGVCHECAILWDGRCENCELEGYTIHNPES